MSQAARLVIGRTFLFTQASLLIIACWLDTGILLLENGLKMWPDLAETFTFEFSKMLPKAQDIPGSLYRLIRLCKYDNYQIYFLTI